MACQFSFPVTGDVTSMLARAKSAVEGQGGNFNGDDTSGSFEVSVMGKIEGSYNVSGGQINIDISSKPMFIPCSTIESFLKKQMS
jgi:hypothetical protein